MDDEQKAAHVKSAVDDPSVTVAFADPSKYAEVIEPSKVSPTDSRCYLALERSIRQTFPGVVVAPYLVTAATDSRMYQGVTDNIYRFLPIRLTSRDLERMHGVDERIAKSNWAEVVQFYGRLIRNMDQ